MAAVVVAVSDEARPPEDEIPVAMALEDAAAVSDRVAVYFSALSVHSGGLLLSLDLAFRPTNAPTDHIEQIRMPFGGETPVGGLVFGLRLADGREASNWQPPRDTRPDPVRGVLPGALFHLGSSASGPRYTHRVWIRPLPEEDAQLFVEWPDQGIERTFFELPAKAVHNARSRVRRLWA